jgi:DHA1 family bicyclomycin/chloramphenicol resistance-like MFS transporter
MSFKNKSIPAYTPLIIILSFITYCIEIDLAVPSFPFIVKALETTEALLQMTLSLNFLGFCLGGVVYGPLSDTLGRRPTLLIGCGIYVLGGIGCALTQSIESLLLFRFIQGLGASSGCVILYAMIADIYPPKKMAWFHGIMNAILTIVMASAPLVGAMINQAFGWRAPLITIAGCSFLTLLMILYLLPETLETKIPSSLKKIFKDYQSLLKNREFMLLTIGPSLLIGVYLTFVGTASFFYQTQLGLPIMTFAIHQGFVLISFALVSMFSGKLNTLLGIKRSIIWGNGVGVLGAFFLLILGFYDYFYPYSITIFMCLHVMGIALSFGTTVAIAFNVKPDLAGASSSLIMAARLLFSSGMIAYASKTYDGSWLSIAQILFFGALVGSLLILYAIKISKNETLKP